MIPERMRAAVVALLVTSACATANGPLRERAVGTLRDALSASPPEARVAAVQAAERLDVEALFDPVTRLLADDDERVRAAAAVAVLRGHPDAPDVLGQLLFARDPAARVIAVAGLGRKVGAHGIEDLRPALADPDPSVREAAVVAIAPMAEPVDVARLAGLAGSDPSGPVRARAVAALQRHAKDPGAAGAIAAALRDPYLGVRIAAATGHPAGVTAGASPEWLAATGEAAVALCAGSPDASLRASAANAAGAGQLDVVRKLARDPDPAVRLAAARALARSGQPAEARELFRRGLGLGDPWLRLQSAVDLAALGDPAVLDPFAADPAPPVRMTALAGYPRRGPVPQAWIAALDDPEPRVRVLAAELILIRL